MADLLVNTPSGVQQIIQVGEGGGYFDSALVIWDDRIDGPLPEIRLGGMLRVGDVLEYSQQRMDDHTVALNPPPTRDEIIAQIEALDFKCIRPLADGDSEYLSSLNAQISDLRTKL